MIEPELFNSGLRGLRNCDELESSESYWKEAGAAALPKALYVPWRAEGDALQKYDGEEPRPCAFGFTTIGFWIVYDLIAFWRTGHTTCGVGHVTQEQVTRTTARPPENISFGKYGHLGHEYHAELGRWDSAFGF